MYAVFNINLLVAEYCVQNEKQCVGYGRCNTQVRCKACLKFCLVVLIRNICVNITELVHPVLEKQINITLKKKALMVKSPLFKLLLSKCYSFCSFYISFNKKYLSVCMCGCFIMYVASITI